MKKTIFFNLNFDDFHPQTDSDGDFGGDLENGNFKYIRKLLIEFPDLKINMFTTPNWIDTPYKYHHYFYYIRKFLKFKEIVPSLKNEPYRLDKHLIWVRKVNDLINKNKIEIAVHGYYHYNPKEIIHGQEFKNLSYEESLKRIILSERLFEKCNLRYVKIFRPPGWGFSEGLLKALRELKYKAIALNQSNSRTYRLEKFYNFKNIPQNYSIKEKPYVALEQAKKYNIVFAKGHMSYKYGKEIIDNGLNEENYKNLRNTIKILKKQFVVIFLFLSEFLDFDIRKY